MTVYVDDLKAWGWKLRGHETKSCHMFAGSDEELHAFAAAIGLKRSWFQDRPSLPHYDLTPSRRAAAIANGAVGVSMRTLSNVMYLRRAGIW